MEFVRDGLGRCGWLIRGVMQAECRDQNETGRVWHEGHRRKWAGGWSLEKMQPSFTAVVRNTFLCMPRWYNVRLKTRPSFSLAMIWPFNVLAQFVYLLLNSRNEFNRNITLVLFFTCNPHFWVPIMTSTGHVKNTEYHWLLNISFTAHVCKLIPFLLSGKQLPPLEKEPETKVLSNQRKISPTHWCRT